MSLEFNTKSDICWTWLYAKDSLSSAVNSKTNVVKLYRAQVTLSQIMTTTGQVRKVGRIWNQIRRQVQGLKRSEGDKRCFVSNFADFIRG